MSSPTRNAPAQKRSRERRETIVEAARRHYDEVGRDRFEIPRVAEIAGCSPGTVYYYFKDRVSLLDYIKPTRDEATMTLQTVATILRQDPSTVGTTVVKGLQEIVDQALSAAGQ